MELVLGGSGISPIRFSPIRLSPMAKVHRTFANASPGISPIGESTVDFRQCISENFANWREYSGLSPMRLREFRQLARVQWTFANVSTGILPIGESMVDFRQLYSELGIKLKFFINYIDKYHL
jgi:hypothetical protein